MSSNSTTADASNANERSGDEVIQQPDGTLLWGIRQNVPVTILHKLLHHLWECPLWCHMDNPCQCCILSESWSKSNSGKKVFFLVHLGFFHFFHIFLIIKCWKLIKYFSILEHHQPLLQVAGRQEKCSFYISVGASLTQRPRNNCFWWDKTLSRPFSFHFVLFI